MKRITISLFCLIWMSLVSNVAMAVGYAATSNNLLSLQISNLGPTRISMDNQKIMDAFYYPQEAVKLILHQSGSVFVVPNEEHKHVYVTVVGENGGMQDLRLKFVFKQPEPIIIYFDGEVPPNTTKGSNVKPLNITKKSIGEKKDEPKLLSK
jgi:hypothetical protein